MKIALNLDLTLSNARARQDDAGYICFVVVGAFCVELCRVVVILLQQKNFGPNVIYFTPHPPSDIRPGIIDLGAFCVELWPFFVSKRNSVPMSYISLWEHLLISVDFCQRFLANP